MSLRQRGCEVLENGDGQGALLIFLASSDSTTHSTAKDTPTAVLETCKILNLYVLPGNKCLTCRSVAISLHFVLLSIVKSLMTHELKSLRWVLAMPDDVIDDHVLQAPSDLISTGDGDTQM